jgi:RNA polymerase sigma-70 factor (ECF subfamily)
MGDESTFVTLHDTTRGLIFGLLLHILGNSAEAEEVLADVYEEVREQSSAYDNKHEALLTWLIMIAYRRAIARPKTDEPYQGHACSLEITNHPSSTRPKTDESDCEWQRLVCSVLNTLSPMQRQMVELEYFFGLSHNGIAMRLGLPLPLVQAEIQDAMIKLRELPKTYQLYPE